MYRARTVFGLTTYFFSEKKKFTLKLVREATGQRPDGKSFLVKLPKELKQRIYAKTLSTKENPFHFFERLEGRTDFKLRIGDYRVIADINQKNKRIEITLAGHRKNIYKQLKKLESR